MTKNSELIKYKTDFSEFGGNIEIEDFNTNFPNKKRISNYADAINMSNQRKEELKYKMMTMEELRKMKLISNTDKRPSSSLTDEKWQKEFKLRKIFITPYKKSVKKLGNHFSKETGNRNKETDCEYCGKTNWQEYCSYINDVLSNIRAGQTDYCYFIYQIMDLAKFHYNDLRTKYCDGYWEVWLERK